MSTAPCSLCGRAAEVRAIVDDTLSYDCMVCGQYSLTGSAAAMLESTAYDRIKWQLTIATRRASIAGTPLVLREAQIASALQENPPSQNPLDALDDLVEYVADHTNWHGAVARVPVTEYARFSLKEEKALEGTVRLAQDLDLLTLQNATPTDLVVRLLAKGWQRAHDLRSAAGEGNRVFVAMSFDPAMRDVFTMAIQPAIEEDCRLKAVRVDSLEYNGKVDERIIAEIRRARFVVADFTLHRGGVYYEAGFGSGLGLEVIYCCREDEADKSHFDTRQFNHIRWTTLEDLRTRLTARIRATIPGVALSAR